MSQNKPIGLTNQVPLIKEMVKCLNKAKVIALDTEFIRETTFFPKIALIQVACETGAWLVDPTVLSKDDLAPLMEVLTNPTILKVVHAAYADQECLYWAYGIIASPVFDTSIAAALCGLGDNIGLQKLLKQEIDILIPKGRSRVKWLARPLSDELLKYAEEDVLHLVELYQSLKDRLTALNRYDWAIEESKIDSKDFDATPEDLTARLGKNILLDSIGRAVLLELIRWRENKARTRNLPRNWVADNEVLVSMARIRPQTITELKSFRGLNSKEVDRSGGELLDAVRLGLERGKNNGSDEVEARVRLPEIEAHAIDFVQSYISFLAREHAIAHRFLISTSKMSYLIRNAEKEINSWIEDEILTERAAQLVGNELKEFLLGKRGMVLKQGSVRVFQTS